MYGVVEEDKEITLIVKGVPDFVLGKCKKSKKSRWWQNFQDY